MTVVTDWISIDGGVLSGSAERIYRMISADGENTRHNSMRAMREAFGLPLGNEHIRDWLRYWDSLDSEQRLQLRRRNLSTLLSTDFPRPDNS